VTFRFVFVLDTLIHRWLGTLVFRACTLDSMVASSIPWDGMGNRTGMGDRLRAGKPPKCFTQPTRVNSASYPQLDGK